MAQGGSGVLSGDLDLSAYASVDGTIDIHGHKLTVSSLSGAGTITDTTSMSDLTDSDASRVWSPNTYYNSSAGTAKDAFSNPFVTSTPSSTATRVMASNSQLPVVIDYDFRTATVVDMYKLTAGDNIERAPGAWEVFGSNDDTAYKSGVDELSAWKRLDTRFGETWSAKFETHTYGFSNSTSYRYYRIRFTASALEGKDLGQELFISSSSLRFEQDLFLDNMSICELEEKLGVEIVPTSSDGAEFVRTILGAE